MTRRFQKGNSDAEQWMLRPEAAAHLFGDAPQMIEDLVDAGWLQPQVQRSRLTLYDRDDLLAARRTLRIKGDAELVRQAAAGRASRKRTA